MCYIKDLNDDVIKAEELVSELARVSGLGWETAAYVIRADLHAVINSIKHCLKCSKAGQQKLLMTTGNPTFKCGGGCIRAKGMNRVKQSNKNMGYLWKLWAPREV